MNHYKIGRDRNGNKVCKVQVTHGRGFSIQTNGNMPETERTGVGSWTEGEVDAYVKAYGTERQKSALAKAVGK